MRKLIYIHGFASSGNSTKGGFLKNVYGNFAVTPSLTCHPKDDIVELEQIISEVINPLLIGSSLGGFYAEYLSRKNNLDALLINPLTDVCDIYPYIGQHKYFETGQYFNFTNEDYQNLIHFSDSMTDFELVNGNRSVLVAKDDNVIPYQKTVDHFTGKNDSMYIHDTGGHTFNRLDLIKEYIEHLRK